MASHPHAFNWEHAGGALLRMYVGDQGHAGDKLLIFTLEAGSFRSLRRPSCQTRAATPDNSLFRDA
jgi:hypothetical protein